jgi:NADPH:quinone reductase
MKAVILTSPGAPEQLQLVHVADPIVQQPTEMLVQLKAAGVNPIDTKLRQRGTFYPDRGPAILGCDGAGIVTAVGTGVTKFARVRISPTGANPNFAAMCPVD